MIKLIVSDLDGTLLSEEKDINPKNLKAIKYAKEKNVKFVVASGRSYELINETFKNIDINIDLFITSNGAEVFSKNGELLDTNYLSKDLYQIISNIFNSYDIPFFVFTTNGLYAQNPKNVKKLFNLRYNKIKNTQNENSYLEKIHIKEINSTDEFLSENLQIIKFEAFSLDKAVIEKSKENLSKINDICYVSAFYDNVEVTSNTAQKGTSLKKYIQKNNIKEDEVMVIGDSENDLSMFELFKYSYAPSNSIEIIKKMAYKIVAKNDDGAVSEAIYDLM